MCYSHKLLLTQLAYIAICPIYVQYSNSTKSRKCCDIQWDYSCMMRTTMEMLPGCGWFKLLSVLNAKWHWHTGNYFNMNPSISDKKFIPPLISECLICCIALTNLGKHNSCIIEIISKTFGKNKWQIQHKTIR